MLIRLYVCRSHKRNEATKRVVEVEVEVEVEERGWTKFEQSGRKRS